MSRLRVESSRCVVFMNDKRHLFDLTNFASISKRFMV